MNAVVPQTQTHRGLILTGAVLMTLLAVFLALGFGSIPIYYDRIVSLTVPTLSSIFQTEISNATVAMQAAARGMDLKTYALYAIARNLVITLVYEIVAALIVLKAQGEWYRWFTAFVLAFIPTLFLWEFNQVAELGSPYTAWASVLWPGVMLYVYLFPNGKAVPRWTRWPMVALLLSHFIVISAVVYRLMIPELTYSRTFLEISLVIILLEAPFIFLSQVIRYWKISNLHERLQTKWVLAGLGFFLGLSLLISLLTRNSFTIDTGFASDINYLLAILFPLTISISVLRYHLFDIDVIIRKTLIYSVVTGLLALVYFGGVLVLQRLFSSFGAGESPAAIVLSTLTSALLFNPLRKRVQVGVDHRFYRRKYDAQKTVERFAIRARDEVELDRLSTHLLNVVNETVQPERTSLWLRK